QGIEFDYCCCHGSFAFQSEGYETIMVNCNPETVSTDYDTSDRLYFEPLTFEDVMNIIEVEKPEGVVIQFGGQTPLKLALPLHRAGVRILGTSPDAIDLAEDRKRFSALLSELGDGTRVVIGGIMQHIEEAGIHSGDSSAVLPSYKIGPRHLETIRDMTRRLGLKLGVRGLMNVQFAIQSDIVYVLEVNPRASR